MSGQRTEPPAADVPAAGHPACPACGCPADQAQRYCGQCGQSLRMRCDACGAESPLSYHFCGSCGRSLQTTAQPALLAQPSAAPAGVAAPLEERRWVTVLLVDVSGFTAMAEAMDPEDAKALADHCAERLSEEVRRFGGTVINVVGDQVVAVFGAPLAHEDDAERAVRAGLAMRDCSLFIDPNRPITVHVGINTGEVMAGLTGPQERRDYTVIGDVVNTAARLLTAAASGSVLVGEQTYNATKRAVRYRELPSIIAKGKGQPVRTWEALEAEPVPEVRPLGIAPLIGRQEELEQLLALWKIVVREQEPHLVTLLGEPGIGKSRLVMEFERRLPQEARVLHGRCLPYGEALTYWALAIPIKEAAGISAEDQPELARARLGALVEELIRPGGSDDPALIARHLALLSGLDIEVDRASGAGDQRILHASVRRFLAALAGRQPLCLIIDDIHWADEILLDLIEQVASRVHGPLLLVTQARPELLEKRPVWGRGVRRFSSLPLSPLDQDLERELVLAICRERRLPAEVAEQITRSSGGNPLFAEELVAMVAERGIAEGVPSLIKLLILARLDLLPTRERRILQLASVFGKIFWQDGLLALGGGQHELSELLEALERKDLVRAPSSSQLRGDREYSFKHDLIRDVAYEMLPRAERRRLHGQVVDWFEASEDRRPQDYLDLLGHHALQAGQEQRAITYLVGAAERARLAAAHRREAALIEQVIRVAEQHDDQPLLANLHFKCGRAQAAVGLWAAAAAAFEQSLALMPEQASEQRARCLSSLAMMRYWLSDISSLRRHGSEALQVAMALERSDLIGEANTCLALGMVTDGEVQTGLELAEQALIEAGLDSISESLSTATVKGIKSHIYYVLGRYDKAIPEALEAVELFRGRLDTHNIAMSMQQLGLSLAAAGHYRDAGQVFEEALAFSREYENWPLLARSLSMSAGWHLDLFDFAGNQMLAEQASELARSINFLPPHVSSNIDLLLNLARCGEVARAEQLQSRVAEAVQQAASFHGYLWRLRFAQAQAEIALARGSWEQVCELATEAIAQSTAHSRIKYQILGLHTRAQATIQLGRISEAASDLRHAVALARTIGDPVLFLKPTTTLLELDGDDALAAEARVALERIKAELPADDLERSFLEAEPTRRLLRLIAS